MLAMRNVRMRAAGDAPGHEFHGNQYSSGNGTSKEEAGAFLQKQLDAFGGLAKGDAQLFAQSPNELYRDRLVESFKPHLAELHASLEKQYGKTITVREARISVKDVLAIGEPKHGEVLVDAKHIRTAASVRRDHNPLHAAADKHLPAMTVAVSYAFMRGRKAYKCGGKDAAVKAIRAALLESLPPVLLKTLVAGGEAGLGMLKLRAAGDVDGHEFHGNQWKDGASTVSERTTPKGVDVLSVSLPDSQGWISFQTKSAPASSDHLALKHVPSGFAAVKNAEVKTKGTGEGFRLYKEALGHLHAKGFEGIASNRNDRNESSNKLWDSFKRHGAEVTTVTHGDDTFDLLKHLSAAVLRSAANPISIRFDATDENAIQWAHDHAAELATGISDTSRERIANAIERAVAGDGIDAAYDDILAAVGDEDRADMIARTEVMTAANEGQREGWDQAVEAGLLPDDSKVEWIATSGCCDDCDELDGETRDIDGEYDDADAGDGPPLHPNCRCTEGIAAS